MSGWKKLAAASAGGGASNFGFAATDNSAYQSSMYGEGIAKDSSGNYIAVGRVVTSTRYGYLIKMASDGSVLASYRIDLTAFAGEPSSICIDSSDNIYVGGRGQGGSGQNPLIMKFNSSFVLQWAYVYDWSIYDRVASYRGQYTDVCTDDTDVFFTAGLDISGGGVRGLFLRVSCANGTQVAGKVAWDGSGIAQDYRCNIAIDSTKSYVMCAGHNENWGDPVINIWDLSTNNLKSGQNTYRASSSFQYDGYTAGCGADDNGNFFATGQSYDTSSAVRRMCIAEFDPTASVSLTSNEYAWSTITGANTGMLSSTVVPVNDGSGDVLLVGAGAISGYSARAFDVIRLDSTFSSASWANRYEMYGSYDSGNNNQFNMTYNNGNRGLIDDSGSNLVHLYTLSNYAQTSTLNADHLAINSLPIDGSGVGTPSGINVISFTPTGYNVNQWSSDSNSVQDKGTATRVDRSGDISIASYSLFNEIAYF
jgi:hypothetical protein